VYHLYSDSRLKAGIFLYHTEFHQSILPPRLWVLRRHVQVSLVQTAVIRINRNLFLQFPGASFLECDYANSGPRVHLPRRLRLHLSLLRTMPNLQIGPNLVHSKSKLWRGTCTTPYPRYLRTPRLSGCLFIKHVCQGDLEELLGKVPIYVTPNSVHQFPVFSDDDTHPYHLVVM